MDLLVRGKYVLTDAGAGPEGLLADGAVAVSGRNIAAVGPFAELAAAYPAARVIGDGNKLILPGLVDAHSHGRGLTPVQKGTLNDYLENNLLDWAFMPVFEAELLAALCALRHIRGGSTLIHHNGFDMDQPDAAETAGRFIRTYQKCGIRVAFSPGVRNLDRLVLDSEGFLRWLPPDMRRIAEPIAKIDGRNVEDDYFQLFEHLFATFNSAETKVLLSPSWAQACTPEFLLRAGETARRFGGIPIHMHCLQTPVQKVFSLRKHGKTAVRYLDDLGLVGRNTVLGHAIWVTEEDIEILAARQASVTTHPSCNLAMRNGLAPVYFMLRQGINVAVGMDDKTINDDEDIVMELRMLHKLHRVPSYNLRTPPLSAREVIKMATVNGARVTGFENRIGTLRPGMAADLIAVDLERTLNTPWLSPDVDIVEAFLHRAMGTDVDSVVIDGRVVMAGRKVLTIDVEGLYKEIGAAVKRGIPERQAKLAQNLQALKPYCQEWYNGWLTEDAKPFYPFNSKV